MTVDIPSELLKRAKVRAVLEEKDLRTLVIEALEAALKGKRGMP
jgi:hypothetical protein